MNNSRRQFLQGLTVLPFLPHRRASALLLNKYPLPEFAIGDLVATDWADDEDDLDSGTEIGEIVGMRWVPEEKQYLVTSPLPASSWVYFVCWTCSTAGHASCYPHYDEDPYPAGCLRLARHE